MAEEIDFITQVHLSTARDYIGRVNEADKADCAERAVKWDYDYWDGERKYGYGGYSYDGRWRTVAESMVKRYALDESSRILDVGCGKGYLLYEFTQVLPGCHVTGIDISQYAIENAKEEIRDSLKITSASDLPFEDANFDFVYSINTFHNLYIDELYSALSELTRVSKSDAYITVESYRSEREKMNLLYWQLTCRAFHTPTEWRWIFERVGYTGDFGFIYFE